MYKKSKRFLAGFLALLLTVTMLPTDMLSVVYAEEDNEAIVADVSEDNDVEEAEALENAVLDDDAEEALEEDNNLKDPDPSEPGTTSGTGSTEPGTTSGTGSTEPATESGTGSTEPATEPGTGSTEPSTEPGTGSTEPATEPGGEDEVPKLNLKLDMKDMTATDYTTNYKKNGFTILATKDHKVTVDANKKEYTPTGGSKETYPNRLKTNSATSIAEDGTIGGSIMFQTADAATVKIYALPANSSNLGKVKVKTYDKDTKTFTDIVGFNNDTNLPNTFQPYSVNLTDKGTYYIVVEDNPYNIYNIEVTYAGVTEVYKPETVQVTFNANGGLAVDSASVDIGSICMEPVTVKDGYNFKGWYTSSDLSGDPYNFESPVTTAFTLYAGWEVDSNAKNLVLDMASLSVGSYSKSFTKNGFTVTIKDSPVSVTTSSATVGDDKYTQVLKTGGKSAKDSKGISFKISEDSVLTIVAAGAGSGSRSLCVGTNGDGDKWNADSSKNAAKDSIIKTTSSQDVFKETAELTASAETTYYISGSDGYNIYYIAVAPKNAAETVSITFKDGETELTALNKTVTKGEDIDLSEVKPTAQSGKVFKGWTKKSSDATADDIIETITAEENTTLYAVWADEVTVTLMNGTTKVEEIKKAAGDTVDLSEYSVTPETGMTFLGWATTEGAQTADATVVTVNENKIYYAVIVDSSSVKEYTVTRDYGYEENGVEKTDTFKKPYTDAQPSVTVTLSDLETPTRAGYTFVKWTVGTPAVDVTDAGYAISADTTFTAVWEVIVAPPTTFTVEFKDNDGSALSPAIAPQTTTGTLNLSEIGTPSKSGYTFKGWTTTEGGTTVVYDGSETAVAITGSTTLYAVWEDIPAGEKVTITLKKNEDDSIIASFETEKYEFVNLTQYAPAETEDGKVCIGWSETKDAKEAQYEGNEIYVTKDMTLYPVIIDKKDIEYTITFHGYYESSTTTMTAKSGDKIKMPKNTEVVSGGTFKGWKLDGEGTALAEDAEYTVSGDADFYADWEVRPIYDNGMDIRVGTAYYNGGAPVLPGNIRVYYKGERLYEGSDYTVKGKNNKNAGTATLTITGIGNYKGVKQDEKYQILPRDIWYTDMTEDMTVIKDAKVSPVIIYNGKQLKLGKDFTLTEGSNIDAKGKYTGEPTKKAEYNEDGGLKTAAETRRMTVKGINNYSGEEYIDIQVVDKKGAKQLAVEIDKNFKPVYGDGTDYEYLFEDEPGEPDKDGKPTVKAARKIKVVDKKAKTKTLELGTDFQVVWLTTGSKGSAGAHKFTVVGMGEYTGSVTKSYKVQPNKSTEFKAGVYEDWNSETSEPVFEASPTAEYSSGKTGATLSDLEVYMKVTEKKTDADGKETDVITWDYVSSSNYTVSYSGNKKAGAAAKAKINFIGNYKGTKALEVPFTVVGAPMTEWNTTVIVPDMAYTKAGKKYVSKPIVIRGYNSYYGTGTILKANEYTVKYEWASASAIKVEDGVETGYKEDKDVKVAFTGSDKYAKVRVTITPSAKSNYTNKYTDEELKDGNKVTTEKEYEPVVAYYYVRKGDDAGALDLSKAKVEFFSDADYKTKLKAVQFDEEQIFTPDVDEKGNYEKLEEGETRIPVYVKVTVGKTEVPKNLYEVDWILGYYNAGKPTVLITGKGPSETPAAPEKPQAKESSEASGTDGTTGNGGNSAAAATTFAVGSKTATIKIDPIKKWITGSYNKTENPTEKIANFLKEIF